MSDHSPDAANLRRPHPLAGALIERLGRGAHRRVVEFGSGRGRNTAALREAGFDVEAIADDRLLQPPAVAKSTYDAALSTHGFLHGRLSNVEALIGEAARALKRDAPMFATFASTKDARFGVGQRFDEQTYAPDSGDEEGVPHVYFNESALRLLLEPFFVIESLEEVRADAIVGRWAHAQAPDGTVHWFARLRAR